MLNLKKTINSNNMKAAHEFPRQEDYPKYLKIYFATMAMQGAMADGQTAEPKYIAKAAVMVADELLKQLELVKEEGGGGMAYRIKIKTEENNHVHFDTCQNNYTLCGLETGGDLGIGIQQGVRIKRKVNCPHCIKIVEYCQKITKREFNPSTKG